MKHYEWEAIETWFAKFIRKHNTRDELITTNLSYKEVHSYEVAKVCRLIAESLNLSIEEIIVAETIGLLHDTGRFPQFLKYRTFQDSMSENHASLGVRVLEEEGVLANLSKQEQIIILTAIQNHNCFILPKQDDPIDRFSKIIRDADKLDIYRFILESEANRMKGDLQKTILLELDEHPTFSDAMLLSIENNRCCLYSDLNSIHDFKLLQLSWVFDINYPITFKLLQERNYLTSLCSTLPQDQKIQRIKEHVNHFVASQISLQTLPETSEG